MTTYDVVVVGGGHNGLACAAYLARAGLQVLVLEMAPDVGGAVHTAATIPSQPAYRFDTCSTIHNLLQTTSVLDELRLGEVGLRYVEYDPWFTSILPEAHYVRFYRSVERTCAEIARFSPSDADAYRRFIALADPLVDLGLAALRASEDDSGFLRETPRAIRSTLRLLRQTGPLRLVADLAGPSAAFLAERFTTNYAQAGIAAQGAHGTIGPQVPGTTFFLLWQAAFHRYGAWHPVGGSGALAGALRLRLEAWGGAVRTSARVERILAHARVTGVELAGGERIEVRRAVVAAVNPQTALLDLLGAHHLPGAIVARLRARHRSNAVHFVVHAALDRLPPWTAAPLDVWNGMQSVADSVQHVQDNFLQAEAGCPPERPAFYVITASAIDSALAPPGKHTAYIAAPAYPARFADGSGWPERAEREAARLLDAVEERAPGFRASITGLAWRHALDWEREIGLLDGHPMHLDVTLDQVGLFRPLLGLATHRTPVPGLYLSGAGTFPTGGVSCVPGRATARAVLSDLRRLRAPRAS